MLGPSRRWASAMFSRSVPQCRSLLARLREGGIARDAAFEHLGERRLDDGGDRRVGRAVVRLDQRVPRVAGQADQAAAAGACATSPSASADISSKPTSRSPSACLQPPEQGDGGGDVGDGHQRRRPRPRRREQLQHRRGDDAERALGADEQLLEVVAGVVLAQAAQAVPDAPVGQHDLEAEHELARVAEAQHRGAAGVGGRCCRRSSQLPSAASDSGK